MKTPTPPDTKHPVESADSTAGAAPDRAADDDRALQGEGNYTAARRHRDATEDSIDAGRVELAARDAALDSAAEEQELNDAEAVGLSRARQ